MATGKLSVRQKMINMMYLVLLAILALNVSAEVLKAFYVMEVSLEKTGKNIDDKNNVVLQSFGKLMKTQPQKTEQWNAKALEGQKVEQEFVQYVEALKREVEEISGGREVDDNGRPIEMKYGDNTEKHANVMLNSGKAKQLREKINSTRDKLIALVPQADRQKIKTDMFTLDEGNVKWENATFEGVPVAAVMATFTKLQNDCKNTYADVLNILYSKVGEGIIPVNTLEAKIIPKAQNVMVGEQFQADIMLSAFDTEQAAEIVIDGKTYPHQSGKFQYTLPANAQGEHTVKGVIRVKERDGVKEYPFATTYNVFGGSAAVSAEKMNIVYVGLINPISISVPGVSTDKIVATVSAGTLRKVNNNKYELVVPTAGEVFINVGERRDDGTVKQHIRYPLRAKKIPDPEASYGALRKQINTKAAYLAQSRIFATPKYDIGFAGVSYTVNSYQCMLTVRGEVQGPFNVRGSQITQEIKDAIGKARSGDMIIFRNFSVTGPLGPVDNMQDIAYTIR